MPALYTLRTVASSSSSSAKNGSSGNSSTQQQNMEEKSLIISTVRPPPTRITDSATGCMAALVLNPPAYHHHYHQTASQTIRPKRVTDPLNEIVRARLCGDHSETCNYGSSGSEHGPNSACLADMVYGFMEDGHNKIGDCGRSRCNCLNGTREPSSDNNNVAEDAAEEEEEEGDDELRARDVSLDSSSNVFVNGDLGDILEGLVACINNPVESVLLREAAIAVEKENRNTGKEEEEMKCRKPRLRRSVMNHLRGLGYNAGICKSRWEHTGGFPSGDYEYIDVVMEGKDRLFLDIDFKVQFEIARPTRQYDALVQILPDIFVGKADRLKQIVRIMCDSAKRSLKKKGMHLPPWRKNRYMQAKWFGPYKRTTNPVPSSSPGACNKESLVRDFGGIALKGSGWDNGFTHQMELHYERTKREAKERKLVNPKLFVPEEIAVVSTDWKPPTITPKPDSASRQGKVSGLASALNGAGLTCLIRSETALLQLA